MGQLEAGAVVRLKSGSPLMTVMRVTLGVTRDPAVTSVAVTWNAGGLMHKVDLPAACLVVIEEAPRYAQGCPGDVEDRA
jgi:uncharacterized protein YodC (DUF2158 family)